MACDHQEIAKTRQVGDDVAREAIAQVSVARIARQVVEREHSYRGFGRGLYHLAPPGGFGGHRRWWPVDLDREHLDRLADVPQAAPAERAYRDAEGVAHGALHGVGDADAPWLSDCLKARRHIDAVPLHVGIAAKQHLADVDADAERDGLVIGMPDRVVAELALDGDGELQCPRGAFEQGQPAAPSHVLDPTAVVPDQRPDESD